MKSCWLCGNDGAFTDMLGEAWCDMHYHDIFLGEPWEKADD